VCRCCHKVQVSPMVLSEEHLKDWRQMLLRLQHQNLVSNQIQHVRQLQEAEVEQSTKSFDADTEDEISQSLNPTFNPDDRVFVDGGGGSGRGVGVGQGGKAPKCVLEGDGRLLWGCKAPSLPLVGAGTEGASAAAVTSASHSAIYGGGGGGGGGVGAGGGGGVGKAASLTGGRAVSVLPQSRIWENEEEEWKRSAPTPTERHQYGVYGGNMESAEYAGNIDGISIFHDGMSNSSNDIKGGNHNSASRTSSALLASKISCADTEKAAQMREAEALLDGFTLEACRAALRASGVVVRTGGGGGGSGCRTGSTGCHGGKLSQRVIGGSGVGDSESFAGRHAGQEGYGEAGGQGVSEGSVPAAGSNRCSARAAGDGKMGQWEIFPVNLAPVDTAAPGRHTTLKPLPVRAAARKVQGAFDA